MKQFSFQVVGWIRLPAIRESPENLRYYRDRARALAKGPSRPYVAPKSIQERRKIINSSRYGLGVDDVDKTVGSSL